MIVRRAGRALRPLDCLNGFVWLAALLLTLAALALGACTLPRSGSAPGGLSVAAVTIQVDATPTLGAPASRLVLPLIRQGIVVEPTPTLDAGGRARPARVPNGAVNVISAWTYQRTSGAGLALEVEGEVRNDYGSPLQGVRVVVQALSASGSPCGRSALSLLGQSEAVLGAGETWPFSGIVYLDCEVTQVRFEVTAVETSSSPVRLAVEGTSVGVSGAGDWQLSGTLRNTTDASVAYARALVVLRAADGAYLASGVAYASSPVLAPGETALFVVTIPASRAGGWADYATIGTGGRQ